MRDQGTAARTLPSQQTLRLTPVAHALIQGYPWAVAYLRMRAAGITPDNARVLADAGYDVTAVTL